MSDVAVLPLNEKAIAALRHVSTATLTTVLLKTGLAVWCRGVAAPPSVAGLTFVNWQEPIGCGGVAVYPNDVIVTDADGAVLIPAALLDEVIDASIEQERLEGWIMQQVEAGIEL